MGLLALCLAPVCAALACHFAAEKGLIAASLFIALAAFTTVMMIRTYPHSRLGLCNAVTLLRAGMACALTAPLFLAGPPDHAVAWTICSVAALALALDGLDGWAARSSGLGSNFGARFDMEVDAAFGLILAALAIDMGKAGAWVLLLGSMRYLFGIAALWLPWLGGPLPERFSRKLVCVLQITALITLLAPPITGGIATLIALTGILALAWSFAVDVVYLANRRPT
jgi:phosphatidylglycerophosphate synthase